MKWPLPWARAQPERVAGWIVVDTETTGLDPDSGRLLSIGAVRIRDGLICLGETFEATLKQARASAPENILVHGIDGTTQTSGAEPREALLRWQAFAADTPLVAFHADFDRAFVRQAFRSARLPAPRNRWLDAALVLPAFVPEAERSLRTLDDWARYFDIANPVRHHALGDALVTAQLFQVALARAAARGVVSFERLASSARASRWLRTHAGAR